jgi:hypothetical protein
MNEREVGMVLDMIRAHYWQTLKSEENDRALMLRTWTLTLEDVSLTPYIENALEWWFKHEKWPPQASDLRERAKTQMRNERKARENRELMDYLSRNELPAGNHDTSLPALTAEWNRRRKAGEPEPVVSD